jgi:electron transport complex protein RnfD
VAENVKETESKTTDIKSEPKIRVASSPHLSNSDFTTRRMMMDVLLGLLPVFIMAIAVFKWYAVKQVGLSILSCLLFEYLFTLMRGKKPTLGDYSAVVTGTIIGFSLPWSAPWFVPVVASLIGIGVGKIVFGGLGYNLFNPAMVGRAFVMFSFPVMLGAPAYQAMQGASGIITQATPLTAAKESATALWPLFLGTVNGSLGEVSAIACILGGLYLCWRRTASWEIPASAIVTLLVLAGLANVFQPSSEWTVLHHLCAGAFLLGAFFIATDPVTSPLSPKGKMIFGAGYASIVMLLRVYSSYPEGVMFAVLIMNSVTPLLNRISIPVPLGGPVPVKK